MQSTVTKHGLEVVIIGSIWAVESILNVSEIVRG